MLTLGAQVQILEALQLIGGNVFHLLGGHLFGLGIGKKSVLVVEYKGVGRSVLLH